ncbi:MAG: carboxypeptidase regulatory-like domain-containing protein [Bacteroidetes bacterium]|nr:carboxypeptidase regulatory-like domain-containing protein [Bacteroidota bacterium]
MKLQLTALFAILFVVIFVGCDRDDDDVMFNKVGAATLQGTVTLIDSVGNRLNDASGVTVRLDDSTFSAVTDVNGVWKIHGLPNRTYEITYSKPGFGTIHEASYQFLGGDTVFHADQVLWMPIHRRFELSDVGAVGGYVGVGGQASVPSNGILYSYLLCVASDSTSLVNGPNTSLPYGLTSEGSQFSGAVLPIARLQERGFHTGDHLYAAVYIVGLGNHYQDIAHYNDPHITRMVFPSAGPASEVMGFTLP